MALDESQVLCAVIAGLLHYLFTASFAWMCLEGVQLYLLVRNLKVVKYSSRQGLRRRYMLLAGYGSPALIVAVSAGVFPGGYGTNKFCWLSHGRGFVWSFLGPVCVTIAVNTILFIAILWTLRSQMCGLNADVSKVKDTRVTAIKLELPTCFASAVMILNPTDRNVCGSKSIVVLYILLMATSMVWMILLSKAFAKHSEISAEIENLRNSRTILKGNATKQPSDLQAIQKDVSRLKTAVCVIQTCPCEWTLFSGKCYYFSNENRDWKKAREFCQSQDSDLAVINSDEELNYLKGKVRVAHLVGMSDLETEGVWKWLDGSLVDGRMWNPGEPNNQGKEDCGEMSNGKLNDIPCNIKQRWICEKTL
ncbi:UNVERIFIED_CONTAM: hypothetical protein FKN15_011021 [Acipenser sinensis]